MTYLLMRNSASPDPDPFLSYIYNARALAIVHACVHNK